MKSINWEDVPQWVKWVAQDADGEWNGYDLKPTISKAEDEWCREDLVQFNQGRFITLYRDKSSSDWKTSLVERVSE